jgi:hypothetical protein
MLWFFAGVPFWECYCGFIARFYHPELTQVEIEALGTLHERIRTLVGENTAV